MNATTGNEYYSVQAYIRSKIGKKVVIHKTGEIGKIVELVGDYSAGIKMLSGEHKGNIADYHLADFCIKN